MERGRDHPFHATCQGCDGRYEGLPTKPHRGGQAEANSRRVRKRFADLVASHAAISNLHRILAGFEGGPAIVALEPSPKNCKG